MKPFLSLIIAMALFGTAFAQNFYLKAGLGYAFPHSGQTIDGTGSIYGGSVTFVSTATNSSLDYKIKSVSFSAGMQTVLGAGIMLGKNIGIELNAVAGVMTRKIKYTSDQTYTSPGYTKIDAVQQAKLPVILCPSLVLQTGDKLKLYARGGVAIPVKNKILVDANLEARESIPNAPVNYVTINQEIKMRMTIGITAAMGLRYTLNKSLSVWAETDMLSLSPFTKKATVTRYDVNGQDYLVKLKEEEKVTEFKMKNSTTDPANSNVSPAYSIPYSNFNITAGVTLGLW